MLRRQLSHLLGLFLWGFFFEGVGCSISPCLGDCAGAYWGMTVDDAGSVFFFLETLGWVQSFLAFVSRLFKFVDVSIFFFLFFFFPGFLMGVVGWDESVKVACSVGSSSNVVAAAVIASSVVGVLFPFLTTWVHLSSGLFGWFSGTEAGFDVEQMVLLLLMSLLVLLLAFDFWRQTLNKWPNCLQDLQSDLLLSMTTIICWSLYVIIWGMAWKSSLLRRCSGQSLSVLSCLLSTLQLLPQRFHRHSCMQRRHLHSIKLGRCTRWL